MAKKVLPNVPCPICGNPETVGHGTKNTKSRGVRRRRECKVCASTFYEDEAKTEVK